MHARTPSPFLAAQGRKSPLPKGPTRRGRPGPWRPPRAFSRVHASRCDGGVASPTAPSPVSRAPRHSSETPASTDAVRWDGTGTGPARGPGLLRSEILGPAGRPGTIGAAGRAATDMSTRDPYAKAARKRLGAIRCMRVWFRRRPRLGVSGSDSHDHPTPPFPRAADPSRPRPQVRPWPPTHGSSPSCPARTAPGPPARPHTHIHALPISRRPRCAALAPRPARRASDTASPTRPGPGGSEPVYSVFKTA